MHRYLFITTLIALIGCGAAPSDSATDAEELGPPLKETGVSLNGVSLNGVSLNGVSLNGVSLNGVSLNATNFSASVGGASKTGAQFVGAKWSGHLSNGTSLTMRIDSRVQLAAPNTDVYAYGVSYASGATWAPLCGVDTGGAAILAIPLSGVWNYETGVAGGGGFTADPTRYTFACRATAIAKCVELGYKPWKTVAGVSLQDHQVACTRMLRADYCGNGEAWTVDGTPINIYDSVGIQADAESWSVEAEWTAAGARCETPEMQQRFSQLELGIPPCFPSNLSPTCGATSHFKTGTLLIDEYNGL